MADVGSIHREMFDVVKTRDLERLRELYHRDYEYRGTDGETGGVDAGIAIAEAYISAFPDLEFTIEHQYTPTESVSIIELTATGTHQGELEGIAATGRSVQLPGCNVIEVAEGKIVREREYFDTMALMTQLGVMDTPSS